MSTGLVINPPQPSVIPVSVSFASTVVAATKVLFLSMT